MSTIPRKNGNGRAGVRLRRPLFVWIALLGMVAQANLGCTRTYYRDYADSDVYGILKERLIDWRWKVPERPVEADPRSRMADLNDPNHVPIVPDEVAARKYQVSNRFPFEYRFWNKRGTTPIEDLSWQPYVPVDSDGKVVLSKDSIMRLGMINSRDYQTEYESLYLAALQLTLARFQFMIQGYSIWGAFYTPLAGSGLASTTPSTTTGGSSRPPAVPRAGPVRQHDLRVHDKRYNCGCDDSRRHARSKPSTKAPTSIISSYWARRMASISN